MFRSASGTRAAACMREHRVFKCTVSTALLAAVQAVGASTLSGVVAILQGGATVIRAISQFGAVEGMRLFGDDLWWMFIRPVARISALADRISLGQLDTPGFRIRSRDEIRTLADSLARLRKSLVQAMKMLEA
jgi:HAMP domain-containing protein